LPVKLNEKVYFSPVIVEPPSGLPYYKLFEEAPLQGGVNRKPEPSAEGIGYPVVEEIQLRVAQKPFRRALSPGRETQEDSLRRIISAVF
jgi:hypothetical protein